MTNTVPYTTRARPLRALCLLVVLAALNGCAAVEDSLFSGIRAVARDLAGLTVKQVSVRDTRITYMERPGPGPVIVLVHGFAANKDNWIKLIPELPEAYRIIAIDMPGHGGSDFKPPDKYAAPALAETVAAALAAIGVRRYHLVGHSLGGLVTTLMAARDPERIATLALLDPAGVYPPTPSELQRRLKSGDNPLLVKTPAQFDRLIGFVFHEQPFMPWPVRPALARQMVARQDINQRIWNDMYGNLQEVTGILPRLRMPVLLMWGDHDRVLDVSSVSVYKKFLPTIHTALIANSGHSPMMERPEETAHAYLAFLRESSTPYPGGSR